MFDKGPFVIATAVNVGEWERAVRVLDEADQWSDDFRSARLFNSFQEAKVYKEQPHVVSDHWKYLMTACEKSEARFNEINSNTTCQKQK